MPKDYSLFVKYYMADYTFLTSYEWFMTTVQACTATISSSVTPISASTGWGDDAISIDLSSQLSTFSQSPDCGYKYVIQPKLRKADNSLTALPIANMLTWDAANKKLIAQKCSKATFALDPQCQFEPFDILWDIVFEVSVDGVFVATNRDLEVRIEVGNTCKSDYLKVLGLLNETGTPISNQIDYTLREPASPMVIKPLLQQGYPFCPIVAKLTDANGNAIDSMVVAINKATGTITINSNDRTLHNEVLYLKIALKASLNLGLEEQSYTFSVKTLDQCYSVVPTAAVSPRVEVSLFYNKFQTFTPATTTQNCGEIIYSLTHVNADGRDPIIEIATQPNTMHIYGDNTAEHVGLQQVRIQSCIRVYENKLPIVRPENCKESATFIVNVFNPCLQAVIDSKVIPSTLSVE